MRLFIVAAFLFWCSIGQLNGDSSQDSSEDHSSFPMVETRLGIFKGFYNVSRGGVKYEAYQGIRYAQPPTGKFRFKFARKVTEPWKGILDAKNYAPACPQSGAVPNLQGGGRTDSEDCLFLNVYTPRSLCSPKSSDESQSLRDEEFWHLKSLSKKMKSDYNEIAKRIAESFSWKEIEPSVPKSNNNVKKRELLPVIVFIHGGAFRSGNLISYRPTYIMDLPLIFVQITYRLGVLGFLSTQDHVVPGNLGLKDQVIALQWVKDNIECFGGDPEKIMIVGQSAGGASVHFHYLTPITEQLFRVGFSLSGTALNCWVDTDACGLKARLLAERVNCSTHDTEEMVNCMRKKTYVDLVQASSTFSPWVYNPITPFGPCVEKWNGKGKSDGEFVMIDRMPYRSLREGRVQKKPWMTSVVTEDGLFPAAEFIANRTLLKQLNDNWDQIAPLLLDFNYTIPSRYKTEVAEIIRKHYFGNRPIDSSDVNAVIRMVTDRLFKSDAELAAQLQAAKTDLVWSYVFGYRQNGSLSKFLSGTNNNYGVAHIDDLAYVLDAFFNSTTTPEDREMQNVFFRMWLSFAYTTMPDIGFRWDKVKPRGSFQYLNILSPTKIFMAKNNDFGEENFWRSLRFNENGNYHSNPFEKS